MNSKKNPFLVENLNFLAASRSLKQKDFAKLVGVSLGTVNNYLNGKSEPSIEMLRRIASVFDVSLIDLVDRDLKTQGPITTVGNEESNIINRALLNEVKRLNKKIKKQGGDDTAAEAALKWAASKLRDSKE